MIVKIATIVEIGIPVVVWPAILDMVVKPMTKIPAMTYTITVEMTMIDEMTMIVEIGVPVVGNPVIVDTVVGTPAKISAVT
jgi:hypothetical protein